MLSRSGFPRNPHKYQGGWITALLSGISMLAGAKGKKDAAKQASADRARELDLEERGLAIAEDQNKRAGELYDYYTGTFQPAEKELVADAFDREISPARAEARAIKDTRDASANARGISERNLNRLGVNPNSGRFVSSDRAVQLGEAALEAGARTGAREATRDKNFARQLDVISLGRGLPASAGSFASMAQQGYGNAALSAGSRARGSESLAYDAGADAGASMTEFANDLYDVFSKGGKKDEKGAMYG